MHVVAVRGGAFLLACLLLVGAVATTGGAPVPPGPASPAAQVVAAGDFGWPLAGPPPVTRRFDPPPEPWLSGHRGVDLAGAPGAVVRAAGAGVVLFAGPVAGRGVVSIDHRGGLRTTYQPVTPAVSAGDRVATGDPIGVLEAGHAGCPAPAGEEAVRRTAPANELPAGEEAVRRTAPARETSACLHWGLRRGEVYLDPLTLLGLGRVRLLPAR